MYTNYYNTAIAPFDVANSEPYTLPTSLAFGEGPPPSLAARRDEINAALLRIDRHFPRVLRK